MLNHLSVRRLLGKPSTSPPSALPRTAGRAVAPASRPRFKSAPPPSEARQWLYIQARREWDTRLGQHVLRELNWRRSFFGSLALNGLLACLALLLGRAVVAKPKAVPHVIEIDRIGTAHYRGPVGESGQAVTISERSIRQHLRRFVTDLRSISNDRAVIAANIREAWSWATPVGQNLINKYVQDKNPINRALDERVSVEIESLLALSRDSWRVEWKETSFDPQGVETSTTAWRGAFRLVFRSSEAGVNEEMLEQNPLGLYIDYFDVQRLTSE